MEISKEEYFRLKKAELMLNMLENAGVDNWQWYGDALNPEDDANYDFYEEQLRKEIFSD